MSESNGAGKVAVVTGAGKGAGRVIAERLAQDGFLVAVGDIDEAAASAAAEEIGNGAVGMAVDVSSAESAQSFIDGVVVAHGRLDVLINNAGVISFHPLGELEEEEWDRVLDIDLKGVYLCTRAALPHLTANGWGRVVSISSDVGKRGEGQLTHYCAAKFGVIGFTQALALEVAKIGVTVNAICPAIMQTDMMRQIADEVAASEDADADDTYDQLTDVVPIGRATKPDDIAKTISWLVSDDAEFITGQAINVTGGRWMS